MKKLHIMIWTVAVLLCMGMFGVSAFADEGAAEEDFEVYSQEDSAFAEEDFLVTEEEPEETVSLEAAEAGTISLSSVTLKYSSKLYTGSAITQTGTTVVKAIVNGKEKILTKGTDYSISYQNNVNAGTATMIVKGKGSYTGTIKKTFTIKPVSLESAKLKYSYKMYTGSSVTQTGTTVVKATVAGKTKTLTNGTDYKITYQNNVNVGKATMVVKGRGNYTGTIKKTFYIYPEITSEQVILRDYKYNETYGYWQDWHYRKITAKQGDQVLWTKNTGKEVAAQLSGVGTLGYNKYGMYYYYTKGKVVAVNILTGNIKWTCDSLVGTGVSATFDSKGNAYVIKQSNPNGDSKKALLYKIDKTGNVVKTINWSDGGKYSGSTSGGAGIKGMEGGNIVLHAELNGQWFTYRTLHINPSTGKIVKVVAE